MPGRAATAVEKVEKAGGFCMKRILGSGVISVSSVVVGTLSIE